jgi:hypothetical protein
MAPFWTDLENTAVCTYHDATNNTFTVQWTGNLYADTPTVEMQMILHQDNTIDFVYGTNHTAGASDFMSVGLQDRDAIGGTEIVYDTPGVISAGASYTLTPM